MAERSAPALETIARLEKEGEDLALVIADQWMPELTCTSTSPKHSESLPASHGA